MHDTLTGDSCNPGKPEPTAATPNDTSGEPCAAEGNAIETPCNERTHQSGVPSKGRPLFIEICAGTAMLSRCFKEAGFDSIAIDHSKNRFQPLAHICNIDLTTAHGWEFLHHLVSHYNVELFMQHHLVVLAAELVKSNCQASAHNSSEQRRSLQESQRCRVKIVTGFLQLMQFMLD